MKKLTDKKSYKILLAIVFSVLVALIYAWGCYPQTGIVDEYSDTKYHTLWAQNFFTHVDVPEKVYMYPISFVGINIFGHIFGNFYIGATVFVGLAAFIACLIQIVIVNELLKDTISYWRICVIGFTLSFVGPIDLTGSGISTSTYLTSGSATPSHNFTYLTVKPFALLVVYLFLSTFKGAFEKNFTLTKKAKKEYIFIAALLFISVLAKPNFYQCFAPAGFIIAVWYFIQYKGRIFKFCFALGLSFIPATLYVIYGMTKKLAPMAIMPFASYKVVNGDFPMILGIIQATMFVILATVYLVTLRRPLNSLWTCWIILIISILEFILLAEPGELGSMNFMWGYNVAQYIAFVFSICQVENNKMLSHLYGKAGYVICKVMFYLHGFAGLYLFVLQAQQYYGVLLNQ